MCYVASYLNDVRLLFRPYVMQFRELREVGESFSSYNPGLGLRFSLLDKCNIDVAVRESQHSSHYNNSCLINLTLYTQNTIKSLI